MGLGVTLSNALSGMSANQKSLDILSRNVANAGTPGYHRQSVGVVDYQSSGSNYTRSTATSRAFSAALQAYHTRQVATTSAANVTATYLDRMQGYLGKPGDKGSLDTLFGNFQNSLQSLATSPDDFTVRAQVLSNAQSMVETLNRLSNSVQSLRQETEGQIATRVTDLNTMLKSLEQINKNLSDGNYSETSRLSLLDQRDRLVSGVAEIIDVRVEYRGNDSVALMTSSGVGLLDVKASQLSFSPAGTVTANSQFNIDPAKNGVGTLTLVTPSGLTLDLVQQGVLRGGELAALVELRDKTLVAAQNQLDEVAAGLAQAMSTVQTNGTAASSGAATGFEVDLAAMRPGNDFVLKYSEGGIDKTVRVVRVDDASKLPLDYTDANGVRVLGVDFSSGYAAAAASIQTALGPNLTVSATGSTLQVLDDGAGNVTNVTSLTARTTVTGTQGAGTALSLFVDNGNADFTNSLDGTPQKQGFAGRIQLNSAVLVDNRLLVQSTTGTPTGDASRPNLLLQQLGNMQFSSAETQNGQPGVFRLNGNVGQLISQTLNFQGSTVANALSAADTQEMMLDAVNTQMDAAYGVNVDEEMARLLELQNAYAANARVLSIVQELLNTLMNAI